jgi:flagellar biosynthesis/type III secretory pathway protein FliH
MNKYESKAKAIKALNTSYKNGFKDGFESGYEKNIKTVLRLSKELKRIKEMTEDDLWDFDKQATKDNGKVDTEKFIKLILNEIRYGVDKNGIK